jgi:hypothetical protein
LHLEGIFRNFGGLFYLTTLEDKLLVGGSAGVPTCVICGANPRSASTVCNSGGDRAVFHAAAEEVVVDAKEILSWIKESVGSIGHCVWFA